MSLCVELTLEGARVLVVGGGRLALRRCRQLLAEGALVRAVSPDFLPDFDSLPVERACASYEPSFLGGCLLAAPAASAEVNRRVALDAAARGILTLAAAPGQAARARVLKSAKEGEITLACSTGGAFPGLNEPLLASLREAAAPYAARLPRLRRLRALLLARGDEASRALLISLPTKSEEELANLETFLDGNADF